MLVAMVSPPFVSSLAYIQLYGRRGWITYRLLHLSLNPYNRWGVILMQSISFVPLNAMFLSGILEKLDEGSLRSARDLGASGGAILRDIVLPLARGLRHAHHHRRALQHAGRGHLFASRWILGP